MSSRKTPRYTDIDGFIVDDTFIPELFRSACQYKPYPDDVIVATYPKCGTTWMCQIVMLILRKGEMPADENYFKVCPFLEFQGAAAAEQRIKPGCIKTHLPFNRITFSKEAKYIYVTRHPKDCVVSFYHHTKFFPNYYFSDGTFDDFFELFVRGQTDFNDYFDNLLSWYDHRDDSNVYFTTFEIMKADPRKAVLDVAKFLGGSYYSDLMDNDELLDKVLALSSFEHMKTTTDKIFRDFFLNPTDTDEVSRKAKESLERARKCNQESCGNFVREGKVGSGKIMLSKEQENRLKERILEKTTGTDVMSLWPNIP